MIDVDHHISAASRRVGSRTLAAGEARVVTIGRTYDTDVDDLWDACTNPERIPRWFLPISGELRLGGRYQLEGNAGGVVERCDPPTGFAATWEMGDDVSWIEVRLSALPDGRARFELDHIAHVNDEFWDQYGPGAVGLGWDQALMALDLHTKSGEAVDPEAFLRWTTSADGRRYVAEASERWYDANVAWGADEAAARRAADNTTAFYTPPPDPNVG